MTVELSIQEIKDISFKVLSKAGSNIEQANAVADIISKAEQDGSVSHGLFRLPGYVSSLKSGKINFSPNPKLKIISPVILKCDGDCSFAPLVHKMFLPNLVKVANEFGVGILSINRTAHFASLWHETEFIAENNLAGIACVSYLPSVAPHGSNQKLYGTNPFSFSWPRKNNFPLVFDMATSSIALGDVMIAARDQKLFNENMGLDKNGDLSKDPNEILKGMLLSFGGYKGSNISMMIELLSGPLLGETSSYETEKSNIKDGGPPLGGQLIIALSPAIISDNKDWIKRSENFINKLSSLKGVRIPGERRHKNRNNLQSVIVNPELMEKIKSLL